MKKKIVITGGLGYIGTELCKLYSGVSWHHEITVIDNRFISERVNQIRNWNMEFIQGDILDKELIKRYCKDADVVHHLAGVTKVPRTKSEASESQDNEITEVAEKGTQNILDVIENKCKIIFPSTHVVYEGIKEIWKKLCHFTPWICLWLFNGLNENRYNAKFIFKNSITRWNFKIICRW